MISTVIRETVQIKTNLMSKLSLKPLFEWQIYQFCHANPVEPLLRSCTMKRAICLLMLSMLPLFSWAVGDECVSEPSPELKLLCQAKSHSSAFYCEKISNFGLKSECIFAVRNRQRNITWGFKPIDQSKAVFK